MAHIVTTQGVTPSDAERIPVADMRRRLKAQGVSAREHLAFRCPIEGCGHVQSIASLMRFGLSAERAERMVSFSCEGRVAGGGQAFGKTKPNANGCDYTLGGLFVLPGLVVVMEDGREFPSFFVATPEEAQALEAKLKAAPAPESETAR